MTNVRSILDFRNEMYVSLFRRWLIVNTLGRNRKGESILSIQKGAFFDFLLKNPKDMHSFLVSFGQLNENSPYAEVLYDNDAEYGAYFDTTGFLESMLLLETEGYIEIVVAGSEYLVSSGKKDFDIEINSDLVNRWKLSLSLLKPVISKSLNTLQKNSLG